MLSVTQHLPHEPPMVLIDGMLSRESAHVVCQCTIGPGFAFLEGTQVSPLAMVEVAAQTAAVYMGMHWQTRDIGFLASCRSAEFFVDAYALGDVLQVRAELVGETDRSGSFECSIMRNGERTARMQLLVVKPGFELQVATP
jgi:predicted hotdog family 3-hydroxylacyl-ACP dehydratase